MSNGYGGSSGSGNRTSNQSNQRRTDPQGRVAPEGFHYMPDGTLMSDAEHNKLYGGSSAPRGIESSTFKSDICGHQRQLPEGASLPISSGEIIEHVWELCAIQVIPGSSIYGSNGLASLVAQYGAQLQNWMGTFPLPSTSSITSPPAYNINFLPGQVVGAITWYANPLWGPAVTGYSTSIPLGNPTYMAHLAAGRNLFYDHVVQTLGPIQIGQRIEVDVSAQQTVSYNSVGMSNAGGTVFYGSSTVPLQTYQVYHEYPPAGFCINDLLSGFPRNMPINGNPGGIGNKLCFIYKGRVQVPMTINDGFILENTVLDVTLDTCDCKYWGIEPTIPIEREPTYNCVKKKVMGQGTGGTPYTYSCEEVHYPLFGTYTSLTGTPVAIGGPQLPGTPTVYGNDGCLSNCVPQTNTGPKPTGGSLYTIK
tara:strand:- start:6214 stop:7476 length:1263 start_codon:yes stop_codon:yes gene_type:complete